MYIENHSLGKWFQKAYGEEQKALLQWRSGLPTAKQSNREIHMGMNDNNSLHSKWNCKYHIVFAPKYRRKVFYKEKRATIGKILRQLCEWKGVKIIEAKTCPDHIHLFLEIPPKLSVSGFMGYLKGKSAAMLYD